MNNFEEGRMFLSPAEVKFTHDSVGMYFQAPKNKININETLEQIAKGNLPITSIPCIKVGMKDGDYYSVDNRRLYVFRVLNLLGLLQSIQVEEVDSLERELTTKNEGCHVWVRNRMDNNGRWLKVDTYRHCSCNRERNKRLPDWWNSRLDSPSWGIRTQQASRQSRIMSVSQQVANASRPNEENAKSTSSHASVLFSRHYVGEIDRFVQADPIQHQMYQSQNALVVKPNPMADKVTNKQFSNRPAVYQASQSSYATGSNDYALDFDQKFQRSVASQTPSSFASKSVIEHFDYTKHTKPESRPHTPASNSITTVPDTLVITAPRSEPSPLNHTYPERSNKRQTKEDSDSISEANCFIDLLKTIFCCVPCKNC